jgi:hypothetical protein
MDLEMLQNSGEEQIIDLFDARLDVAEASIENLISTGIYSDGTANNGKQITGLQAMVVASHPLVWLAALTVQLGHSGKTRPLTSLATLVCSCFQL